MDLDEKLSAFLSNTNAHAFLVKGIWGIGKTFAVDSWLKKLNEYKVVKLSLFGISNVNELNALALKSENLMSKFKSWLQKIPNDFSVGIGPVSVQIPLIGIVSSLLNEKYGDNKKILFVLDDIERKDNALTIEQVFGFVDSLPPSNTKVILIANTEKMSDLEEFKGFKEKVIQDEYNFKTPTNEAIVSIIGEKYSNYFVNNAFPINNLRTLIKIKNILSFFKSDVDSNLINCIYYCCLSIYENRLNKEELVINYRKYKLDFLSIFSNLQNQSNKQEDVEQEIQTYVSKIKKECDFVYENIRLLNLLSEVKENDLKSFVTNVYQMILDENYDDLAKLQVPKRNLPLKKFTEFGKHVFYSTKPNFEYLQIMKKFECYFKSDEYDLLDLFRRFYTCVMNCEDIVTIISRGKKMESKIIKECPAYIAKYIYNNSNFEDDDINSPLFTSKIPDWILDIERNIIIEYSYIFNKDYIKLSQNNKIDCLEMNQRLHLLERVFYDAKIFDRSLFKIDDIMVNAINYIAKILNKDLNEEKWSYCHSLVRWMSENRKDFAFDKSIKLINEKALKNNFSGYRFSSLVKQYNLID